MKRFIILITIVFLLIGSAFAVAQEDQKDKNDTVRIGVSFADFNLEKWPREARIMTETANKFGAQLITQVANHDVKLQNDQIENLGLQGCDVIIVIAEDSEAAVTAVEQAVASGVPVIAYDRMIYTDKLSCYVSGDPTENGRNQARAVLDIIDSGRFALLGGSPTDNNAYLMREGQMEILQPYIDKGQIEIVADQWVENWDPSVATRLMENMLTATENKIDAVIASNDGTALGAIQALRAQGMNGVVPISGLDATLAACRSIAEGDLTCTLYRDPKDRASAAVEIAINIAKGKGTIAESKPNLKIKENVPLSEVVAGSAIEKQLKGTITYVLSSHILVTKDNLYETVILTGYQPYDEVYKTIPESERPPKP